MGYDKNVYVQTREASNYYYGDHHSHLLGLLVALRHHLHDGNQRPHNPTEGCYPAVQQQSDQPNPLHLHQQAGEEGHCEDVHLPGARARKVQKEPYPITSNQDFNILVTSTPPTSRTGASWPT